MSGVVFRVSRDGTEFAVLHAFGPITSASTVTVPRNADGMSPTGALVAGADNYFYGTASAGGANGNGTAGGAAHAQFTRFVLVNVVGFAVVWVVSVGLARGVFPAVGFRWHADTIAHAFGIASSALTSYRGHRLFSFNA